MDDIKQILLELDPAHRTNQTAAETVVATQVSVPDNNGRYQLRAASARLSTPNKRRMILSGMDQVKRRMAANQAEPAVVVINNREVTLPRVNAVGMAGWVDSLIKRWFGAKRDGTDMIWDLTDGYRYRYDIYRHRLTRKKRDADQD